MAEIRANREYKFKEFCISEEIPKCPPIKTKRWTFHDTNPDSRFHNRPVEKKWDDKDCVDVYCSGDTNINQQFIKPYKKPESHLRAEFFNAYKKYYRRVDIKRLEVQSTLNVDAKFKGSDKSVEGESSLYKEKECMEINIVMDTETDDALVSGKVKRTVLSVSPAEEESIGKESITHNRITMGGPEKQTGTINDQNILLGEIITDNSEDCLLNLEHQSNMTPRLKREQSPMNRTFVPFVKMPQSGNNKEPKSSKKLSQRSDNACLINHERFASNSSNDIINKTNLLESNRSGSVRTPLKQMKGIENSKVTGADEVPKEEKNEYAKMVERTFCNLKVKENTKNLVSTTPFKFGNPGEKSTNSELFQNKKYNFKSADYIDCEDAARTSESDERNFVSLNVENFRSNPLNDGYKISENAAKSFHIDYNSRNVNQCEPKSIPDEISTIGEATKKHRTYNSGSIDYNFELGTTGSLQGQEKNPNITVSIFRTESPQEPSQTKSFQDNKNTNILTSQNEFSYSALGIRFRGIRGVPFNESNKNDLKSLIVNAVQTDHDYGRNVIKREFIDLSKKEESNLTQRHCKDESRTLASRNIAPPCCQISDFRTSSQLNYKDSGSSSYEMVEVPEACQNITKSSSNDFKNLCCEECPFTSVRRENIEKPFVICTSKNKKGINVLLKTNKLTTPDYEFDTGNDCDVDSNPQSFSDLYGVHEISNCSKNQLNKQLHQNHSQSLEKQIGKKHLKEVRSENFALPNCFSYDKSSRIMDSCCAKDNPKKDYQTKDAVSLDENGSWLDKSRGDISQRHCTEEQFEKRGIQEISRQSSCVVREKQLTEHEPKTHDRYTTMNETTRMRRNIQEENAGETKFSKHVPIEQSTNNTYESKGDDKKFTKPSSSDCLQIGPTYTVHYTPTHKKQFRTDQQKNYVGTCEAEEIDNGVLANIYQCNNKNAPDMVCKKWNGRARRMVCNSLPSSHCDNERATRIVCNNLPSSHCDNERATRIVCNSLPSSHCDNYLNACHHEIICNSHYKTNGGLGACGCLNAGNYSPCDCDDFNRGFYHRIPKNNNVRSCHAMDSNLHCHGPNDNNCQMDNNHRMFISFPCVEGKRNCCQECKDQQMRFQFNDYSGLLQEPNNPHCFCSRCSNEMRINAANIRKENCGACSGDEQVNSYPLRFDLERQWMSTGHQPMRYNNNSIIIANNDVNESYCRNQCQVNSLNDDNCNQTQECSIADYHRINNPYDLNKVVKNESLPEFIENDNVNNYRMKGIKPERKYYRNPVDSEGINFNFPIRVDNSSNQNESTGSAAKIKPEKKVYVVEETKRFSNEAGKFYNSSQLGSNDSETKDIEEHLKVADRLSNEPLFLCEEQWDSDDGLPMRRIIRKRKENTEKKKDKSVSSDEPIYLREEQWGSGEEETGDNNASLRNIPSTSPHYQKTTNSFWNGQRADGHPTRRRENFSEGEEYKKCSSVHSVSDPCFQCDEQWANNEEKCQNHRLQSTLPKNVTRRRKGKRRSYNPRRWDMVTDLPKNGYRSFNEYDNYEEDNFEDDVPFQNRNYYSNNEE